MSGAIKYARHSSLFVIVAATAFGVMWAQTVPQDFKFPTSKPGDTSKITGTRLQPLPLVVNPAESLAGTEKPMIDSVFPTTTYPVQRHFSFEINGQQFSPDPADDQIEIEGQGIIEFGSRYRSPSTGGGTAAAVVPVECKQQSPEKYPCLEATSDGHRLTIVGFQRRHAYQGPLRVRVWVKGVPSDFSGSFTLSRVDYRIIVWLTFLFFASLMYVVYRLVSRGIKGYIIAGRTYSPLAAFLIDKTTDSYSLSKFQLFMFSIVFFFGYMYVFLCRALVQWNFSFPEIPDNYPSLLAISVGTTVAAIGLTATRGAKGGGSVYPSPADFISAGGLVVAERFQFFVWTLIACIGFIALILMQDPAKVDGFPSLPSGLVYVMGVSAAGYLGGKAVRNPGPILKKVQVSAGNDAIGGTGNLHVILDGENLDKSGKFRIDGASQMVVSSVNGTDQPQGPQGYCTHLEFTLSQAAGFATGEDHTFEIINGDGVGAQLIFTATPMSIINATAIAHGTTGPLTLTVQHFREGSSARWLAPGAPAPVEISATEVRRTVPASAGDTVTVTVPAGEKTGTGTLTLVSPVGGTEATPVMVN